MKRYAILILMALASGCGTPSADDNLAKQIRHHKDYPLLKNLAREVVASGFNAGDGYEEVWIRDYNTFIELAAEVYADTVLRNNLLEFFRLQGNDGNIVDGFVPVAKATVGYTYTYSDLAPQYAGHKNTVETDQESSLIQAIFKYITATGDSSILQAEIGEKTVAQRMRHSLQYLMENRFNETYGLLWGATTADWGDVQPEHGWGVFLTDSTHYAIDVYDNAMFLIALDNYMAMLPDERHDWQPIRDTLATHVRKYLWDDHQKKFKPHLYLNGSPFPDDFKEDEIFYHGGTAVAIEAGLLTREEVKVSLNKMQANVKAAGAATIGLTLYPPYPDGYFMANGMHPYGYQNGGDWSWFGGRMIQQLVRYGYIREAVEELQPMIDRAKKNNGFFEWYTPDNQPKGSGTFRGSAGVLYKAVQMLETWAQQPTTRSTK